MLFLGAENSQAELDAIKSQLESPINSKALLTTGILQHAACLPSCEQMVLKSAVL